MVLFRRKEREKEDNSAWPASDEKAYPQEALPEGAAAPDFTLINSNGDEESLSDFRGQRVILAFYPADWSPVCGDQMSLYNEVLPLFEEHDAQLFGLSVDGKWSHRAYSESRNLGFPLLSDFEPKGEVARSYGVYDDKKGVSQRALFVIDGEGIIRWSYVSPSDINPGANGILEALETLNRS